MGGINLTVGQENALKEIEDSQDIYADNMRYYEYGHDWTTGSKGIAGIGLAAIGIAGIVFAGPEMLAAAATGSAFAGFGLTVDSFVEWANGKNRAEIKDKTQRTLIDASIAVEASEPLTASQYDANDIYYEPNARMARAAASVLDKLRQRISPREFKNIISMIEDGRDANSILDNKSVHTWENELSPDEQVIMLLLSDQTENALDDDIYEYETMTILNEYGKRAIEEKAMREEQEAQEEAYKAFDDSRKSFRDMENNAQNDNYFPEIHLIDPSLAKDINNVATKVLAMEGAGGRRLSPEEYLNSGIFSESEKGIFKKLLDENGGVIDQAFLKKLNNIQDTLDEGTSKSGVAISEGSSAGSDVLIDSGLYSDDDSKTSLPDNKVISNPPETSTSHYSPIDYGKPANKPVVSNPPSTTAPHYTPIDYGKPASKPVVGNSPTTPTSHYTPQSFRQAENPQPKKVSVSVRPKTSWTYIDYLASKVDAKIARSL